MPKNDRYIVAVDVGSTKVGVLVGERSAGGVDVIGKGTAPAKGTRKGNIVDAEKVVESIRKATEEAEIMAGVEIAEAFVGVSGAHVKGFNSRGAVAIASRDRHVTRDDVARAVDAARSISIPPDREILHVIPRQFVVDDQDGVADPVGMVANRLQVDVHVVTGAVTPTQTLVTCVNKSGVMVQSLILEVLAGARAALSKDEKELGCLFLDIGGGTSEYALFRRGSVAHTGVLAIGGEHFTSDLSIVLKTPMEDAERIKKKHGCVLESAVDDTETIEVPAFGGRAPRLSSSRILCDILRPRAEELFTLIRDDLRASGFEKDFGAGVVLAGGGAELDGVADVAEKVFDVAVRKAAPSGVGGLVDVVASPEWTTATGLLLLGAESAAAPRPRKTLVEAIKSIFSGRGGA